MKSINFVALRADKWTSPPILYAAHGWLCTATRLRRREACVAHSHLTPSRGGLYSEMQRAFVDRQRRFMHDFRERRVRMANPREVFR